MNSVLKAHKDLGLIVREYRLKKGLTQQELAQKLKYDTTQFVSLFERGISKIPFHTLGQLIVILGIPENRVVKILLAAYKEELFAKIRDGKKTSQAG